MCIKVKSEKFRYADVPSDRKEYTDRMDKIYTRWTKAYDKFIRVFPPWRKWLESVMPYIRGTKLLEVSFGTGYLLTQFPNNLEVSGLDYNKDMVEWARAKNTGAVLVQGNVENMPYPDASFDTVVNTMAFSGYPDGDRALREMLRVLKPGGRLLLLDYDYPPDGNLVGYLVVRFIEKCGDLMKDIGRMIDKTGCGYQRKYIGACKSVQLFIVDKED